MDLKIMLTTFSMIFLAELGDKTQLAILSFAIKTKSPFSVLLGAGGALLLATVLAIAFGGGVAQVHPRKLYSIHFREPVRSVWGFNPFREVVVEMRSSASFPNQS